MSLLRAKRVIEVQFVPEIKEQFSLKPDAQLVVVRVQEINCSISLRVKRLVMEEAFFSTHSPDHSPGITPIVLEAEVVLIPHSARVAGIDHRLEVWVQLGIVCVNNILHKIRGHGDVAFPTVGQPIPEVQRSIG